MAVAGAQGSSPKLEVDPKISSGIYNKVQKPTDDEEGLPASLKAMITNYQYENNRRYHAYKQGRYAYPNDEIENERLDIMHKLTEVALGGRLHLAPLKRNPERILDIGTGTGLWAIDMGDKYPNSEILGNDLSAIQPQWTPPNVHFEVDDCESDWTYHTTFDYIHCRHMANAIKDWPRLTKQCFEFTSPGGVTELIDLDLEWISPDGTLEGTVTGKMNPEFLKASRAAGFDPRPGPKLEGYLKEAGFKDVKVQKFPMPIGEWPLDPHLKHVGKWNQLQLWQGMESFLYRLFTQHLTYTRAECDVICAKIRAEMRDPTIHIMFYMYVAYGRKPSTATTNIKPLPVTAEK